MAHTFQGVLNGEISQFSLEDVKQKFQVLLFYPSDWAAESEEMLSEFSAAQPRLESSECLVYGVSCDSVHSHQEWLAAANLAPTFPLLSDPAAVLAHRFGIYSAEKEVELSPCRCIVITDNQAVMLELVNTSFTVS